MKTCNWGILPLSDPVTVLCQEHSRIGKVSAEELNSLFKTIMSQERLTHLVWRDLLLACCQQISETTLEELIVDSDPVIVLYVWCWCIVTVCLSTGNTRPSKLPNVVASMNCLWNSLSSHDLQQDTTDSTIAYACTTSIATDWSFTVNSFDAWYTWTSVQKATKNDQDWSWKRKPLAWVWCLRPSSNQAACKGSRDVA